MTDEERRSPSRLGYDLGAETPEEARQFEEVAAELGLAADPVTPPASLKADLFAKLASTPQLPPVDAQAVDAHPVDVQAPLTPAETKARSRWFTRPITIAAAAAAAVVLFLGGTFLGSSLAGNNSFQQQQASALAQINAAPDAQRATADVSGGGTATLVWSGKLGKSALVANDLPALPSDKTYELWYIRGGEATPAGTMKPADTGSTWRVLTGTMQAGDTVGVTVEPRGGSDQPTTSPIVAISS
ncbi:anti-sigma factor [Leifsonia sp. PS1209]|uniref:anti-sigma factor n=1 Tax=Leifsonia sp. PS1209 TaxID=2724914 RepID=UPI001442B5F8|nr:anti-sigma factor [Leifsonia sp. PS1209]QIZ99526.1 anti-sigma factor [Leifsonia sp. PS1209]